MVIIYIPGRPQSRVFLGASNISSNLRVTALSASSLFRCSATFTTSQRTRNPKLILISATHGGTKGGRAANERVKFDIV